MSNRFELNPKLSRLQAVLRKAERNAHLGQPVRSEDLYVMACAAIDEQIYLVEKAIERMKETRL